MVKLINRFHVAVRLFSNRSQMTSKLNVLKTKKWHCKVLNIFDVMSMEGMSIDYGTLCRFVLIN